MIYDIIVLGNNAYHIFCELLPAIQVGFFVKPTTVNVPEDHWHISQDIEVA